MPSVNLKTLLLIALIIICMVLNYFTVQIFYTPFYGAVFYFRPVAYGICLLIALSYLRQSSVRSIILSAVLLSEIFFSVQFRTVHEPLDIASANFAWRYVPLLSGDTSSYKALNNEPVIIFNGDSYGFGYGLTDPSKSYTHLVSKKLQSAYPIVNLAQPESEIYGQYLKLRNYNKPQLIIHQFYITDLCRPCTNAGYPQPEVEFLKTNPWWLKNFTQLSATAQYLSYGSSRLGVPKEFYNYFFECAEKSEAQVRLSGYIDSIYQYAQQKNARIIFMIVPCTTFPEQSATYIGQVKNHLNLLGAEYVDVTSLFIATPLNRRGVSENDHHFSPFIHEQIAGLLLKKINTPSVHGKP